MVVASPAAALLLLLTSTVVATAAKTLVAVRAIGGVTVLVSSSAGIAHSVGAAAVATMALQVARVAAVSTAHLRGLGRRQAAGLSARASVSGRPGTGTPNRGRGSRGLAVAKRLQVVSTRGTSARLGLAVETLSLRLEGGAAAGKAVVGAAKASGTEARLRASLASRTAAVVTQTRAGGVVAVSIGWCKVTGRAGVFIRRVGRHAVWLAVHATLSVRTKVTLAVSRVVLLVVRVVRMVVAGVLLSMALRLRAGRASLSLLTGLSLLALRNLLLGLASRVRGRVATVLAVSGDAKTRLAM